MTPSVEPPRDSLAVVLSQLRAVLRAQADALSAEDFDGLERLDATREQLVAALSLYASTDLHPDDLPLLEQVGALDQRLLAVARDGLERTGQELRDVHRGRGALRGYRQRGRNLIQNLSQLDEGR